MKAGPTPRFNCRFCNAPNDPGSSECWLCQRRGWQPNMGPSPAFGTTIRPQPAPRMTIGGLMIVIAVIGVLLGLMVLVPPVAIVLIISAVPAFIVTEFKDFRRRRNGVAGLTTLQKAGWFIGLTVMIPVTCGAALIAVVLVCMSFNR